MRNTYEDAKALATCHHNATGEHVVIRKKLNGHWYVEADYVPCDMYPIEEYKKYLEKDLQRGRAEIIGGA